MSRLTVCNEHGCPELTPTTRCPAHTEPPRQRKQRGLTGQRGSTRQWRKTRARRIAIDNGRCTHCQATTNLHVHHKDGDAMNDTITNLQSLCEDCHRSVEAERTLGGDLEPRRADTVPQVARGLYES